MSPPPHSGRICPTARTSDSSPQLRRHQIAPVPYRQTAVQNLRHGPGAFNMLPRPRKASQEAHSTSGEWLSASSRAGRVAIPRNSDKQHAARLSEMSAPVSAHWEGHAFSGCWDQNWAAGGGASFWRMLAWTQYDTTGALMAVRMSCIPAAEFGPMRPSHPCITICFTPLDVHLRICYTAVRLTIAETSKNMYSCRHFVHGHVARN